jgi:predicted small integral membrane protein
MNLSLTSLDWFVFSFVMIGSMAFGLWMAYRKKASENSSIFFLAEEKLPGLS